MKKAVLLINLGTPEHCDAAAVKRYLKEFLNDPRVVDLPSVIRWLFVNAFVIPFRYKKTTAAYQKIWQPSGSPLLMHTEALADQLATQLGEAYHVEFAMRYGSPDIKTVLERMLADNPSSLQIVPLFPQYTAAATGSALQVCYETLATAWNMPTLKVVHAFYAHPAFIRAYQQTIETHIQFKAIDKLVFSYHGLPERHLKKSGCLASCDDDGCSAIDYCYRAQCYTTSTLIAKKLGLTEDQYVVSFQSRLGRTPWIKPYTDILLPQLARKGIKNIAVVCPSFVADCLETLEEVNIRTRAQWKKLGGKDFTFIPCLNDAPIWVQGLREMLE